MDVKENQYLDHFQWNFVLHLLSSIQAGNTFQEASILSMNQSYPLVHFEGVSMNSATKKIKATALFDTVPVPSTSDVPVNPILNSLLKTDLQKEESQPVEVPLSSVSTTAFEDAFPPVQNQPLKSFFDEPQAVKEETPEPPPQTSRSSSISTTTSV